MPLVSFVEKHFPERPVRVRRDFPRFLALIEASALLHQHQRRRSKDGRIVATLADYEIAWILAKDMLADTLRGWGRKTERIVTTAQNWREEHGTEVFTKNQMADALRWDKNTVSKWTEPALTSGQLELVEEHRGNKAATFRYAGKGERTASLLPTTEEIAAEWSSAGENIGETVYDPITGQQRSIHRERPSGDLTAESP